MAQCSLSSRDDEWLARMELGSRIIQQELAANPDVEVVFINRSTGESRILVRDEAEMRFRPVL